MDSRIPDLHDRVADAYYGKMGQEFMRATRARIHWICNSVRGSRVLDVGCSQGVVPLLLAREGISAVGIDTDERSIAQAREILAGENAAARDRVEYICDDFTTHRFGDARFDTLVLSEVLEHLVKPQRFVERAAELLNAGGRLVITVPFGINDYVDHKRTYYALEPIAAAWPWFELVEVEVLGRWLGLSMDKRSQPATTRPEGDGWDVLQRVEAGFLKLERELVADLESARHRAEQATTGVKELERSVEAGAAALLCAEERERQLRDELLRSRAQEARAREHGEDLAGDLDRANDEIAKLTESIADLRIKHEEAARTQEAHAQRREIERDMENSQLRERVQDLESQLCNVHQSAKWKLGVLIGSAMRSPRAMLRLPMELLRIYRERKRWMAMQSALPGLSGVDELAIEDLPAEQDRTLAWPSPSFAASDHVFLEPESAAEAVLSQCEGPMTVEIPVAAGASELLVCVEPVDAEGVAVAEIQPVFGSAGGTGDSKRVVLQAGIGPVVMTVPIPDGCTGVRIEFQSTGSLAIRNRIGVVPLADGISVVIATYKGEQTIGACLASLGAQTIDPSLLEVVVVVNGEPDGTPDLVRQFQHQSQLQVKLLTLPEAGVGNARNRGLEIASRRFVAFLDDDDTLSPTYLEALYRNRDEDGITIAQIIDVRADGVVDDAPNPVSSAISRALQLDRVAYGDVQGVLAMNACKLMPAFYVKLLQFDPTLRSGEDVSYYACMMVQFNPSLHIVPDSDGAVYRRTLRMNSVSRQRFSFDFNVDQRLDVISSIGAQLARISGRGHRREKFAFAGSLMRAQGQFCINYLRENPDEYSRFNQTVIERGDIDPGVVRWINSRLASTLVISYCFPPYLDTAGLVTAKRIREEALPVDVISNRMDAFRKSDSRLNMLIDDLVGDVVELKVAPSFNTWSELQEFSERAVEAALTLESRKRPYRKLYSRAMWPGSNFAAAMYKLLNPSIYWVAEFSDPLLRDVHGKTRTGALNRSWLIRSGLASALASKGLVVPERDELFFWCEYLPYCLADEIVFTNARQMQYMLSYLDDKVLAEQVRAKAVVRSQPTLPERFYGLSDVASGADPSHLNIAYFGSFYQTRGLNDLLSSVAAMSRAERSRFTLHIYTNQRAELLSDPAFAPVARNVVVHDYVGFLDFLALTRQFDCLLVNDAATSGVKEVNPYLPSKLSDYFGSGTPIWALCETGSTLDELAATDPRITYRSELGDRDSVRQVLRQMMRDKP